MKNTIGCLKKILIFSSLSVFFLFVFLQKFPIYSSEETFEVYADFTHTVVDSTEIETIVDISLKSKDGSRVLSYYTITIPEEDLDPTVTLLNSTKDFTAGVYSRDGATDITITFTDLVVSESTETIIRLTYTSPADIESSRFTLHSEITDIDTNNIEILYPKDMGAIVWSSNTLSKFSAQGDHYIANITNPSSYDTILIFGDSIIYNFNITRSLNNTLEESSETFDITLPQDNLTQTLLITSIDPLPSFSSRDEEGNLTVSYIVEPSEQINVKIVGQVILLDTTTEIEKPTNPFLLENTGYWNITSEQEIVNIERYIDRNWVGLPDEFESIDDFTKDSNKNTFYKALYKYIVNRLDVDESSLTVLQGGTRDGAESVLEDVSESDSDDYADLCVAVYRYYNIPARMNLGYLTDVSGITEDGIFHSWCEYYDDIQKKWVEIDPFLEDYKEVELFQNTLKDHIKIITRGKSAVSPKLAFYTENNFEAESANENISPVIDFDLELQFEENTTTSQYVQGSIYIKNTGECSNYSI